MRTDEVAAARARHAASALESILAELEAGVHGLTRQQRENVRATILSALDGYRCSTGRIPRESLSEPGDRRANG